MKERGREKVISGKTDIKKGRNRETEKELPSPRRAGSMARCCSGFMAGILCRETEIDKWRDRSDIIRQRETETDRPTDRKKRVIPSPVSRRVQDRGRRNGRRGGQLSSALLRQPVHHGEERAKNLLLLLPRQLGDIDWRGRVWWGEARR